MGLSLRAMMVAVMFIAKMLFQIILSWKPMMDTADCFAFAARLGARQRPMPFSIMLLMFVWANGITSSLGLAVGFRAWNWRLMYLLLVPVQIVLRTKRAWTAA
jgi:hypothetical protein